jgi:hypothetical protein
VISNLSFISGSTAAGTPTNYWFILCDSNRVGLARTADQTTTAWNASTTKTLAVAQTTAGTASSYTTVYGGLYHLGFMIAATTTPSLIGEGSLTAGITSAPSFGSANTGMTTPPAVTSGAFTAAAFSGTLAPMVYGFVS